MTLMTIDRANNIIHNRAGVARLTGWVEYNHGFVRYIAMGHGYYDHGFKLDITGATIEVATGIITRDWFIERALQYEFSTLDRYTNDGDGIVNTPRFQELVDIYGDDIVHQALHAYQTERDAK